MKNWKSRLAVLLCLVMVGTLTACGNNPAQEDSTGPLASGSTRSARTGVDGSTSVVSQNGTTSIVSGDSVGTTSVIRQNGTTSIVTQGNGGKVTGNGATRTGATSNGGGQNSGNLGDLGGRTIGIYEMRSEKMERGTTSGDRYFAILNKVGKKYNCKITYVTDPGDLQTSILSGKPAADIISIQDYMFPAWLNAGVCLELNSAIKTSGVTLNEAWYDKEVTKFCNWDGEQYCWNATIREPYMICYNKRMVQEAKLTDPYKLYTEGKWTYAELGNYMRKLTKKSADGTVLISGYSNTTSVSTAMHVIVNNNTSAVKISNKGVISGNLDDKKVAEALEYFRGWAKDNLMSSGSAWYDCMINFAKGKAAMCLATKYIFTQINSNGMKDAVGVVPFPNGPSAKNAKSAVVQTFPTFIAKSKDNQKDAAKLLYVMNEVYKEHYAYRETDFYDDFRSLIRDEKSYNLYKEMSLDQSKTSMKYDSLSGIIWPPAPQAYFNLVTALDSNTVANAINAQKKAFNTALTDVWGSHRFTKF